MTTTGFQITLKRRKGDRVFIDITGSVMYAYRGKYFKDINSGEKYCRSYRSKEREPIILY